MGKRHTPPIADAPEAIATLEEVTIGGISQWLMLRGADRKKPVLVFLHGGPGSAQIGWARPDQADLERHFVVVNWDQRGAGLSYSRRIPRNSMTIDRFVEDLREVVLWIRARLGHERVFLVGHSWGSILGMRAVQRYPELFHAYFGVSQVVNFAETEAMSYALTLERARELGHRKAVRELEAVGAPPYASLKGGVVLQRWLGRLGGMTFERDLVPVIFKRTLAGPEYGWQAVLKFVQGQFFSVKTMEAQLQAVDLEAQVPSVRVPVHFCIGRHDRVAPAGLAERYFTRLSAPRKEWRWFERSAHAAPSEEPEAFSTYVIETATRQLEAAASTVRA